MTATLNEVLPLTRELDLADRAKLAEQLLSSLDEPGEVEVEKLWIEEARRRLAAYRAAQVEAIPAEEVFRRAGDPDLRGVPDALRRAAENARRLAEQTGTPFVVRQPTAPDQATDNSGTDRASSEQTRST